MNEEKSNLSKTFGICLLAYAVALGVAVAVGFVLLSRLHPILATFAADVAATLVIYVFGCILRNASLYDPYWSVAPIGIAVYWMLTPESISVMPLRQTVAFALVLFWGLRLTYNWARRWRGNEDWRYADIRKQNPGLFWLANLIGIELMPTLLVFLGCLSLYPTLSAGSNPFGFLDGIAIVITVSAILMETMADEQLREFVKSGENTRKTLSSGLWAYTRHPNYLGEMGFWWGLYFFSIAADLDYWWTIIGPVGITFLFVFVSIPMIEKHLSKRSGYAEYQQRVSKLIPWFPKE